MDGFKKHFSLARLALFLWLLLIAIVGLYQGTDPAELAPGSYLAQFAAHFPNVFGLVAAIVLLPVYALVTLEHFVRISGLPTPALVITPLYFAVGVVYLYWLAGRISKVAIRARIA